MTNKMTFEDLVATQYDLTDDYRNGLLTKMETLQKMRQSINDEIAIYTELLNTQINDLNSELEREY